MKYLLLMISIFVLSCSTYFEITHGARVLSKHGTTVAVKMDIGGHTFLEDIELNHAEISNYLTGSNILPVKIKVAGCSCGGDVTMRWYLNDRRVLEKWITKEVYERIRKNVTVENTQG